MGRKTVEKKPIRGKRLKTLCKELGVTQKELAEKIHLTPQTISKIVNGKANLTEDTANEIIKAFPGYSLSLDYLMGFDQEPQTFETGLDFLKEWIRLGGSARPINYLDAAEASIAVALEKMNESGWQVAVDMVESLLKVPAFQKKNDQNNGGNK